MFNRRWFRVAGLLALLAVIGAGGSWHGLQPAVAEADGGNWIILRDGDNNHHLRHVVDVNDIALIIWQDAFALGANDWDTGFAWTTDGLRYFIPNRETYDWALSQMRAAGPTYTHRGDFWNIDFVFTVDKDHVQRIVKHPDYSGNSITHLGRNQMYVHPSNNNRSKTYLMMDFDWKGHSEDWPETVTLSAHSTEVVKAFGGYAKDGGSRIMLLNGDGYTKKPDLRYAVDVNDIGLIIWHDPSGGDSWNTGFAWDANGERYFIPNRESYDLALSQMRAAGPTYTHRGDALWERDFLFTVDKDHVWQVVRFPDFDPNTLQTYRDGRQGYIKRNPHKTKILMDFEWTRHSKDWPARVMLRASFDEVVEAFGGYAEDGGNLIKLDHGDGVDKRKFAVDVNDIGLIIWHDPGGGGSWNTGFAWDANGERYFIPNRESYDLALSQMRAAGPTYTHRGDALWERDFLFTVDKDHVWQVVRFPDFDPNTLQTYRDGRQGYIKRNPHKTKILMDFEWTRHSKDWPARVMLRASFDEVVEAFGGYAEDGGNMVKLDHGYDKAGQKDNRKFAIDVNDIGLMIWHNPPPDLTACGSPWNTGFVWHVNGRRYKIPNRATYDLALSQMRAAGPTYISQGDFENYCFKYTVNQDHVQRIVKYPDYRGQVPMGDTGWVMGGVGPNSLSRFKTRLKMDFDWTRHSKDWPETVTLVANLPGVVKAFGGYAPKP